MALRCLKATSDGVQGERNLGEVREPLDDRSGICHSHLLVQARYSADQRQGPFQPLIMNVKVMVSNRQLEASGVTATNALVTAEATKLAEKQKGEACNTWCVEVPTGSEA